MFRRFVFLTIVMSVVTAFVFADNNTTFTVKIENVSNTMTLKSVSGQTAPAGFSPGVFILYTGKNPVFEIGKKDQGKGLENQAEDGNPAILAESLKKMKNVKHVEVFNMPVGKTEAGPILPGGAYEFTFTAEPGMKLMYVQMFGQSNDLFYSLGDNGIDLFDSKGMPVGSDLTPMLKLWDAGTEVNQEPGFGSDQAPRQADPNTGAAESKPVGPVNDGFTYPPATEVLQVTITHQ